MRDKIDKWLSDKPIMFQHADNSVDLSDFIEQCFNDLQGWVSVEENSELVEGAFYWVLMPSGRIDIMRFNNYQQYGGPHDYWQELSGNDYTLENTKYIEIPKPKPPSEDE
jgi:hypothetical protein